MIEMARILTLITVVVAVSAPFAIAMLWAQQSPGLSWPEVLSGFISCSATTLFVATLVYLLAACDMPYELVVSVGVVSPFFGEGISTVLKKSGHLALNNWIPPGLPYSLDSATDPAVRHRDTVLPAPNHCTPAHRRTHPLANRRSD